MELLKVSGLKIAGGILGVTFLSSGLDIFMIIVSVVVQGRVIHSIIALALQ